MERPYDKDIELLMGDLNVHSYIAHHYAQEQIEFGKTAERLQEESVNCFQRKWMMLLFRDRQVIQTLQLHKNIITTVSIRIKKIWKN